MPSYLMGYEWTLEVWTARDSQEPEFLTATRMPDLEGFDLNDMIAALRGEVVPEYIPDTPVAIRLAAIRKENDGTETRARVQNGRLPKFFSRPDGRDGTWVHLSLHDALAGFQNQHRNLILGTEGEIMEGQVLPAEGA